MPFFLILLLALVVPVSATVTDVYAISTNADGRLVFSHTNDPWATLRMNYAASSIGNTTANFTSAVAATSKDVAYETIIRFFWCGDTSSIPDDETITGAVFSVYADGVKSNTFADTINISLSGYAPADPTITVLTDYNATAGDIRYASDIAYASWTTESRNNFTFTEEGLTNINKTGYTCVMVRSDKDVTNVAPVWENTKTWKVGIYDTTKGTTYKPFLEVTSEADTEPPEAVSNLTNTSYTHAIQFTWDTIGVNQTMVWKDGVFLHNVTDNEDYWRGLDESTSYTISTKTENLGGFVNDTWVNLTASTTAAPTYPKLIIMSDDGSDDTINNMYPILSPYNLNATTYMVKANLDKAGYMLLANLTTLDTAGWDVANHGAYHVDMRACSTAEQEYNILNGTEWLDSVGLTRASRHYAYPYGMHNAETEASGVAVGALTMRTTTFEEFQIPYSHVMDLPITVYVSPVEWQNTPTEIETQILELNTGSYVIPMLFHRITDNAGNYNWSIANFQETTDWIYDRGYPCITISEFYTLNTVAPVASFTTNVTSGTVPLAVGFTDTSTNTPTSWNWSFGDGNWSNGTASAVSYLYEYPGTYNAFLIASNGDGSSTSATTAITVTSGIVPQCENQTGNITLALFFNSTTSLGWNWDDPVNITKIAEDGLYVLSFDNSSDYFIGTGYSPKSWHKLRIYNETDFGQLNCTTDAIPVTPTPIPIMPSTESNVNPANLFQYWPYAVLVLGLVVVFKKW